MVKKISETEAKPEMAQKKEVVTIQALNKKTMIVKIKGTTPLLMEKMDIAIAETIDKKKSKQNVIKDDRAEVDKVKDKIHYTEDGNIGFPAIAFHKAMIEVAPYLDGLDKKLVRGSIRVNGGVIPINFKSQTTNKTWGKSSGITKAPRLIIRPEFRDWNCELSITYNETNISKEHIVNLLNWAGFQCGIGSYRPACSGSYGQFEVVTKA
jgi:hypothetical protein